MSIDAPNNDERHCEPRRSTFSRRIADVAEQTSPYEMGDRAKTEMLDLGRAHGLRPIIDPEAGSNITDYLREARRNSVAVDFAQEAFDSGSFELRTKTAYALSEVVADGYIDDSLLKEVLHDEDEDERVQIALVLGLANGGRGLQLPEVTAEIMLHESEVVRMAGVRVLADCGWRDAVHTEPFFEHALKDSSPVVRKETREAIEKVAKQSARAQERPSIFSGRPLAPEGQLDLGQDGQNQAIERLQTLAQQA